MTHAAARLVWISAAQCYWLVCDDCGLTLSRDTEALILNLRISVSGDCKPPVAILGIDVQETIGVRDIFGHFGDDIEGKEVAA